MRDAPFQFLSYLRAGSPSRLLLGCLNVLARCSYQSVVLASGPRALQPAVLPRFRGLQPLRRLTNYVRGRNSWQTHFILPAYAPSPFS